MPANPRSRYGILSAEILPASELLPLIDTMTLDEQIRVSESCGRLKSYCWSESCMKISGTRTTRLFLR
jgi:hypothetical protein